MSSKLKRLMMKIYLKKEQFELLNKHCNIDLDSVGLQENDNKVSIAGNKQYFESLLDKISDVLTEKGMNSDDEPNELGLQIEDVIDILSKVVYD